MTFLPLLLFHLRQATDLESYCKDVENFMIGVTHSGEVLDNMLKDYEEKQFLIW